MNTIRMASVLAFLMVIAAIAGTVLRPTSKVGAGEPRTVLEELVPTQFGDWRVQPQAVAQVVNPQAQQLLNRLYSQTLSRTYVNAGGYRVMLSLAYGDDQRGDLKAHKPEACYPAQGFTVHSNTEEDVITPFGHIAARRLSTSLGPRKEPVTYWFTVGNTAVRNKVQQRLAEIRLGLTGQVPDGLLFRVSSFDDNPVHAYEIQQAFVSDLLKVVSPQDRARLSGLRD